MNSTRNSNKSLLVGSLVFGACCVVLCVALTANAQYNTYDSDSNSDSEGGPILTNAELGKLSNRGSGRGRSGAQLRNLHNEQQQQLLAATRNRYNRQQALQFAPTQHNRRQYGSGDSLSNYNPLSGAASTGRERSLNNDEDEGEGASNFGPNFGANFDGGDGESQGDAGSGAPINLNQAASGYPGQGDYNDQAAFGFGPGYGASSAGAEAGDFGASEGFGGERGRRAKAASSLMGSRNLGADDDAGAPQYGPNSAINAGEADDEGHAGYSPEASNDNSEDDD